MIQGKAIWDIPHTFEKISENEFTISIATKHYVLDLNSDYFKRDWSDETRGCIEVLEALAFSYGGELRMGSKSEKIDLQNTFGYKNSFQVRHITVKCNFKQYNYESPNFVHSII